MESLGLSQKNAQFTNTGPVSADREGQPLKKLSVPMAQATHLHQGR